MNGRSKLLGKLYHFAGVSLSLFIFSHCQSSVALAQGVGSDGSYFTDVKAHKVGDLLTVLIFEDAQASNQTQLQTQEKGDFSTKSSGGVGPLKFIPLFSADNSNDNKYDGKGTNSRQGSLKAKMTVEVSAERANGDLVLTGTRMIEINSEQETMTLTGIVRKADINPDNTVDSYNIANAKISYTGKGPGADGAKPGIISKILNWIL
jgi:flagellar L-ring protein precursor FlgH